MPKTKPQPYLKALILSFISALAFAVNNGTYAVDPELKEKTTNPIIFAISQINSSLNKPSYMMFFFIIIAFVGFLRLIPGLDRKNFKWNIPFSLIASLFFLLCDSYFYTNSWDKVFGSTTALITSALKGSGIAVLVFFVYDVINRIKIEATKGESPAVKKLIKLTAVIVVCWIPYMIIMAPGGMSGDTRDQFGQFMGITELCWSPQTVVREPGDILLTNHHPVFHTVILGIFLKIGEMLGSYAIGTELFAVIQCIFLAGSLAYCTLKLREFGMSKKMVRLTYVFFALFPLFPLWGMSLFKDAPFTIALLVMTILLYDAFRNPHGFTKFKYFALSVFVMLLMLVRNNGFYLVLLLVPFVIIHFRKDKKFLLKMGCVLIIPLIIFKFGYQGFFFDAMGINQGSPREMLSVPFQQTARYISEYGDEITPEEEKNILAVLSDEKDNTLEGIAARYVPDRADSVKAMYNKYATGEDLANYFKTWAVQLTKHPGVYVEAFLNLNYSWFTFSSNWDYLFIRGVDDSLISQYLEGIENPQSTEDAKLFVFYVVYSLMKLPVIGVLFEFSSYTWAYVVLFIAALRRKRHRELLACLPIFVNYLICFVGPVAYMRYVIPMLACLPFAAFIIFSKSKMQAPENKKEVKEDNEIWIK